MANREKKYSVNGSMAANRSIKPKYKVNVGRIFQLRNVSKIPCYTSPKPSHSELQSWKSATDIGGPGKVILILDENNSRVNIFCEDLGGSLWIPKYYLLKEAMQNASSNLDDMLRETNAEMGQWLIELRQNADVVNAEKLENLLKIFVTILDKHNL